MIGGRTRRRRERQGEEGWNLQGRLKKQEGGPRKWEAHAVRHLSSHPPLLTSLACSNDPQRRNDTDPKSEYPTKRRNPTTTKTSQPPVTTMTTLPQRQPYHHNKNPTTTATIRLPQQCTPTTRPPRQHNTGQHNHQTTQPPANERTPRPLIEPHNDQTRRLIAMKRMGRKARRRARKKDGDGEEGKDKDREEGEGVGQG